MPATADSAGKLVPRRTHAKSKKGCRTCKRRKVKCDEQRPSCGNCDKHNVTCDFLAQPESGLTAASQALSSNSYASPTSHTYSSTPVVSHGSADAMQIDATGLNMVDLQLLHNFTTFTHATLSNDPNFRHMLKTSAISMAFGCEFLMRTVLALSALHLARFRLDKREYYVHIGLSHYQVACYQATTLMDHIDNLTRENCENLHLFSVLTLFYALGSPKNDQTSLVIGDTIIPNWLTMLRSAEPILSVLNPMTYKGVLSPLFSFGRDRWNILNRDSRWKDSSLLVDLETNVNRACTDPELLSIYNSVIKQLRHVLTRLLPQPAKRGSDQDRAVPSPDPSTPGPPQAAPLLEAWDIFVWQWNAAKDFIPLLRGPAPQQEAIAIYAHFLIMLKKLENQWWLEGWATHMMEMIWASLDDEHRLWIQWPIQEIGWVPP